MTDEVIPRLIRVGEFERVGCKCKQRECGRRTTCVLSQHQLSDASFMPRLEPELSHDFETPVQVMVWCRSYKEEPSGEEEARREEGQEEGGQATQAQAGEAGVAAQDRGEGRGDQGRADGSGKRA